MRKAADGDTVHISTHSGLDKFESRHGERFVSAEHFSDGPLNFPNLNLVAAPAVLPVSTTPPCRASPKASSLQGCLRRPLPRVFTGFGVLAPCAWILGIPRQLCNSCEALLVSDRIFFPLLDQHVELPHLGTCNLLITGGGRGIRTPGRVSPSTVFKTAALNHSAIPPVHILLDQHSGRGFVASRLSPLVQSKTKRVPVPTPPTAAGRQR
jgi:hypothetical protein